MRVAVPLPVDVPTRQPRSAFSFQRPSWARGAIHEEDARFLHDTILDSRPRSALEIGVASGCSSVVILKAFEATGHGAADGPWLHSFDVAPACYFAPSIPTGAAVAELVPHLLPRFAFVEGDALTARQRLRDQHVDFAFVDGNHYHPWPVADVMALLPVLSPGAWIVLHDINLPNISVRSLRGYGPEYLYARWPFEKRHGGFGDNVGAIRVPRDLRALAALWPEVLDLPWEAALPDEVCETLGIDPRPVVESERVESLRNVGRAARQSRPIWIWGTGEAGRQLMTWLTERGTPLAGFIDRDPARHGGELAGLPVVSPATVRAQREARPLAVVAGRYRHEIARELVTSGWRRTKDFIVL